MRNYEITFLTREDTQEEKVKAILENLQGNILSVQSLGQKNLVYKIEKESRAYFTSVIFELAPDKLEELNRKLKLEEDILRYLIISVKPAASLEEVVKEVETEKVIKEEVKEEIQEEIAKEKIEEKEEVKKIEAEVEKEEKKEEKKPEKPKEIKKKVKVETAMEATEEERLEALDKKLEELLKE